MTEKKRYIDESEDYDCIIRDNIEKKDYINSQIVDLLNEYDSELQMCREKVIYWKNKAKDIWGDMRTNVELEKENEQLKHLIKQVLETTPIEHTLAMDLKNSIRELYDGDVE